MIEEVRELTVVETVEFPVAYLTFRNPGARLTSKHQLRHWNLLPSRESAGFASEESCKKLWADTKNGPWYL